MGRNKPAQTAYTEEREVEVTEEPMQEDGPSLPDQMTLEQAMTHYHKTVEDVHRKRVNKLNAFNYRMTQYLMNVFSAFNETREQEAVKWENYGEGIDVCAEVYGYCVDFVHMSTNRLMNGLHRINGEPEEAENDPSADDKDQEEKPKKQKHKPLKDGLTTLEPPESLQSKTIEKGYELDPFYAKMSSCFDAGKSEGILLNNLKVNEGLELLLYSKEPMECPFDQPFGVFQQPCFADLTVEKLEEETLCKELEMFEAQFITGTQPRQSNFQQIIEGIGADMDDPSDIPDQIEESAVYHETFENTIPGLETVSDLDSRPSRKPVVPLNESLGNLSSLSDFHFFSAKPSTWAGFEYWNRSVVSIGVKKSEKKSRRKEPVNFEYSSETIQDRKAVFQSEGKDHVFRQKYFDDFIREEMKLPMDYQVSLRRFTQTFSKPNTQVKIYRHDGETPAAPVEENVVCVQNYGESQDMDGMEEDENDLYAREEEVAEPPVMQVQTREEQLQFSKVSKRVDIRLLKDEMWKNLGAFNRENILGAENRRPQSRSSSISKSDSTPPDQPTFMQVVRGLPDKLPTHELENLSIHSCFIAMLHLANEKSK